jgi:hypothetical protein
MHCYFRTEFYPFPDLVTSIIAVHFALDARHLIQKTKKPPVPQNKNKNKIKKSPEILALKVCKKM